MTESLFGVPAPSGEYGDFTEGHIVFWGDDMPDPNHQAALVDRWRKTHLPHQSSLMFVPDWNQKDYMREWTCWQYNPETGQIEPWWQHLIVTVSRGVKHIVHLPVGNYDYVLLAWFDKYFPGAGHITWEVYTGNIQNIRCWEYDPATKTIK
jgi:hypothetical protein